MQIIYESIPKMCFINVYGYSILGQVNEHNLMEYTTNSNG